MSKLKQLIKTLCPEGVEYKSISTFITDRILLTVTPSVKVKKNQYCRLGKTPIISQEAEYISGYCQIEDEKIPLGDYICFGDHTEHIKFVDFSFVQGADGLRIIKGNNEIDLKYVYYAVSNYYVKHNNYERHFKYFLDTIIPVPPIEVQREIVRILDVYSQKNTELIIALNAELSARKKQYEYYRNELLNVEGRIKNVEWKRLNDIFYIRNGYTPLKINKQFWSKNEISWFRMDDIRENGRILDKAMQGVTLRAIKGKPFPANSIIISTSATIGEHALIRCQSLANQRFTYLMLKDEYKEKYNIMFLFYYCFILDEYCKDNLNQGNFASVDMRKFNEFEFPVPPIEEQERIVAILDRFDKLCNDISQGLPAEIKARKKQYEYYRDKLLTFKKLEV